MTVEQAVEKIAAAVAAIPNSVVEFDNERHPEIVKARNACYDHAWSARTYTVSAGDILELAGFEFDHVWDKPVGSPCSMSTVRVCWYRHPKVPQLWVSI